MLKPGTVIQLADGRIGTICWSFLDGQGGVWGRRDFSDIPSAMDDRWPPPEFMLREKAVEASLRRGPHRSDVECVGQDYEVLDEPPFPPAAQPPAKPLIVT